MKNLATAAIAVSNEIYDIVDDKLQPQYRLSKDPQHRFYESGKKTRNELKTSFSTSVNEAMKIVVRQAEVTARLEVEKIYDRFIPIPTAGLRTRLLFLFTGKLS